MTKHNCTDMIAHLLQLGLGDAAYAVCAKVCVSCLYATQTAEVFIARLLPLCNQVLVSNAFLQAILIQLCEQSTSSLHYLFMYMIKQTSCVGRTASKYNCTYK